MLGDYKEGEKTKFLKEFKESTKTERHQLTSDKFTEILSSEKFLAALSIAAKETQSSGLEAGFNVILSEYLNPLIENVEVGSTDLMSPDRTKELAVIDGLQDPLSTGQFLVFHFHPEPEGLIQPSASDLFSITDSVNTMFLGIGQVRNNGNVSILLVRSKTFIDEIELNEFEEEELSSQSAVNTSLEAMGFSTTTIQFIKKNRSYSLSPASQELLLKQQPLDIQFPI